jgi:hypothetical protein
VLATIVAGVRLGILERVEVESVWRYRPYADYKSRT